MRFLIVEDDPYKLNQLEQAVSICVPNAQFTKATSLQDAMTSLDQCEYDHVLLDMAIPSHSSETGTGDVYSQPVGGLDVLLHLAYTDRPDSVIILTQHPTVEYNREHVPLHKLQDKLLDDEVRNVRDVILFAEDGGWRGRLAAALGGSK